MGFGYLFHIKIENIVRLLLFIHKNVNKFVRLLVGVALKHPEFGVVGRLRLLYMKTTTQS